MAQLVPPSRAGTCSAGLQWRAIGRGRPFDLRLLLIPSLLSAFSQGAAGSNRVGMHGPFFPHRIIERLPMKRDGIRGAAGLPIGLGESIPADSCVGVIGTEKALAGGMSAFA